MQVIERFLRFLVEPLALCGQLQPCMFAAEEFQARRVFQQPDRLADRGLADIQFFCRSRKAPASGGGLEAEEIVGRGDQGAKPMHNCKLCPPTIFINITGRVRPFVGC